MFGASVLEIVCHQHLHLETGIRGTASRRSAALGRGLEADRKDGEEEERKPGRTNASETEKLRCLAWVTMEDASKPRRSDRAISGFTRIFDALARLPDPDRAWVKFRCGLRLARNPADENRNRHERVARDRSSPLQK